METHDASQSDALSGHAQDTRREAVPVAHGPELPFTVGDLEACVKVIIAVRDNPRLYTASWLRRLRKAITPLVDSMVEEQYDGIGPKRKLEKVSARMVRDELQERMRQLDADVASRCRLRADRVAKMERLQAKETSSRHQAVPRIPDGPADDLHNPRSPLLLEAASPALPSPASSFHSTPPLADWPTSWRLSTGTTTYAHTTRWPTTQPTSRWTARPAFNSTISPHAPSIFTSRPCYTAISSIGWKPPACVRSQPGNQALFVFSPAGIRVAATSVATKPLEFV